MRSEAAVVLEQVGLKVDPDTRVRNLIVAEKQLVEIAKALARKAKLLIMDEPTATLTPGETERLFKLIAQLNASGVTVLYISHKLDEVERITDEVIVMRDGRFVTRELTRNVTRHQMANLMVGRELSDLFPPKTPAPGEDGSRCCGCKTSPSRAGPRMSASKCGPARSSVLPGWLAPGAPSYSRGCWGCASTMPNASSWVAARCDFAVRAMRPTRASPTLARTARGRDCT